MERAVFSSFTLFGISAFYTFGRKGGDISASNSVLFEKRLKTINDAAQKTSQWESDPGIRGAVSGLSRDLLRRETGSLLLVSPGTLVHLSTLVERGATAIPALLCLSRALSSSPAGQGQHAIPKPVALGIISGFAYSDALTQRAAGEALFRLARAAPMTVAAMVGELEEVERDAIDPVAKGKVSEAIDEACEVAKVARLMDVAEDPRAAGGGETLGVTHAAWLRIFERERPMWRISQETLFAGREAGIATMMGAAWGLVAGAVKAGSGARGLLSLAARVSALRRGASCGLAVLTFWGAAVPSASAVHHHATSDNQLAVGKAATLAGALFAVEATGALLAAAPLAPLGLMYLPRMLLMEGKEQWYKPEGLDHIRFITL